MVEHYHAARLRRSCDAFLRAVLWSEKMALSALVEHSATIGRLRAAEACEHGAFRVYLAAIRERDACGSTLSALAVVAAREAWARADAAREAAAMEAGEALGALCRVYGFREGMRLAGVPV